MMKRTIGPENVNEIRQELKTETPELYTAIKQLYDACFISGLRGIEIETGIVEKIQKPEVIEPTAPHCEKCKHWRRDKIGDGTGIGRCLGGDTRKLLHWPKQWACHRFEGII